MKEVQTPFSTADSELVTYSYIAATETLNLQLKLFNLQTVEFSFHDVIYFFDHGTLDISSFVEADAQDLCLAQAVKRTYSIEPAAHPYHAYKFLDLDQEPSLEIVCRQLKWSLMSNGANENTNHKDTMNLGIL